MNKRTYNFYPGPATLPTEVLEQAQSELLNWQNKGISVMEISHRSKEYIELAMKAEQDLRDLLNIPTNYKVLFMQGGAHLQFSCTALNLLDKNQSSDYVVTGIWSQKALKEAQKIAKANVIFDGSKYNFTDIGDVSNWQLNSDAGYVHYCSNETVGGLQLRELPNVGDVPLVCDMSSDILSRPIDISKFGLIYAGAQKNMGPSGITVVIVREDLLTRSANTNIPSMLNYNTYAGSDSMYNTPPTFAWYLLGLVLKWLKKQGGLSEIAKLNYSKQQMLYDYIDNSNFYSNKITHKYRSYMNVPFYLKDENLNQQFIDGANKRGLLGLKGHRLVGGMRASIYNAITIEAMQKLIEYMQEFAKENN